MTTLNNSHLAAHTFTLKDKANCDIILYANPSQRLEGCLTWADASRRWHELKAEGVITVIVREGELMPVPTKPTPFSHRNPYATGIARAGSDAHGSNQKASTASLLNESGGASFRVDGCTVGILELQHNIDRAVSRMLIMFESGEIDPKCLALNQEILIRSLAIPLESEINVVLPEVSDQLFMLIGHYSTTLNLIVEALGDFYNQPGVRYPTEKVAFIIRNINHGYLSVLVNGVN